MLCTLKGDYHDWRRISERIQKNFGYYLHRTCDFLLLFWASSLILDMLHISSMLPCWLYLEYRKPWKNRNHSFLGKPVINRYVPNIAKPVVQLSNQQNLNKIPSQLSNRYLGISLAAKRSPNYLNSADQWKIYWEIYLNKYNRRNFIPRGKNMFCQITKPFKKLIRWSFFEWSIRAIHTCSLLFDLSLKPANIYCLEKLKFVLRGLVFLHTRRI